MNNKLNRPENLPVKKLRPFEGHPYKVQDNEEMETLTESIRQNGILSPLIIRPMENTDEYEVISGHRRLYAAQKAGLETVPAFLYAIGRDAAAILLVDSNLHREHILPSEKAFAYKMKLEAVKKQGRRTDLTSSQRDTKFRSDEQIAKSFGIGKETLHRYIRLTHLIPELLAMVDEGRIALTPASEISYLTETQQKALYDEIEYTQATPSLSQAQRLRSLSRQCRLSRDAVYAIMSEEKANQKEQVRFKVEDLRGFFPKNYTPKDMTETIFKLLNEYRNHNLAKKTKERAER